MTIPLNRRLAPLAMLACLLALQACATGPVRIETPPDVQARRAAELQLAIQSLGDAVDREEARRAAHIAITYSEQLASDYEVSGSALYHNLMVNLGIKSRGLCIHWTEDLLARLKQERFRSLDLHWAIANYTAPFRLEHSTVIVSAAGDPLQQGIVLDPWRNSGELFWAPTLTDIDYPWQPRAEILALKRVLEAEAQNRTLYR